MKKDLNYYPRLWFDQHLNKSPFYSLTNPSQWVAGGTVKRLRMVLLLIQSRLIMGAQVWTRGAASCSSLLLVDLLLHSKHEGTIGPRLVMNSSRGSGADCACELCVAVFYFWKVESSRLETNSLLVSITAVPHAVQFEPPVFGFQVTPYAALWDLIRNLFRYEETLYPGRSSKPPWAQFICLIFMCFFLLRF